MELLFTLFIFTVSSLTASIIMNYVISHRFPRPLWALLVNWWWPFQNEDAATLIATDLDLDENCSEWKPYHYDKNMLRLQSVDGKFLINFSAFHPGRGSVKIFCSRINSTVQVQPTAWSDNALYRAAWRWRRRRNTFSSSEANKKKILDSQKATIATIETATHLKNKFQKRLEKLS